jgi:hypothetical protein
MPSVPATLVRFVGLAAVAFLGSSAPLAYPQEQHSVVSTVRNTVEHVASDTSWKTFAGNSFVVPAGWSVKTQGREIRLEPPEGHSSVAIFDLEASTADEAVAMAWKAYQPGEHRTLFSTQNVPDYDGWTDCKN